MICGKAGAAVRTQRDSSDPVCQFVMIVQHWRTLMRSMTISFVLILFVACSVTPALSFDKRTLDTRTDNAWIRSTIESRMKEHNIPAVSVGIIRGGKVTMVDGFGVRKRGGNSKANQDSIFQIASLSKTLTAIVANSLIEEGKLTLDEPITTYLPDSISDEATERLSKVTLRHLLQHQAGIPNDACSVYRHSKENGLSYWTSGYLEAELLDDLEQIELEHKPGSKFAYTDSGYALVGYICEKASRESFDQLLKKHVTHKYGLRNTCVHLNEEQKSLAAIPYCPDDRDTASNFSDWGQATPASGIFSNATDLSRLLAAHLKAYQAFRQQGDRPPLILTDRAGTDGKQDGFGLSKTVDESGTHFHHGGSLGGFASEYRFSPDHNIGLVLLTSSGGHWFEELVREIDCKLTDRPYAYQAPDNGK